MNGFDSIIQQLEAQKAAIDKALEALREVAGEVSAGSAPATVTTKRGRPAKRKGGMTEAGRERLRQAMKKRWAVKRTASHPKKRGRPKKAA